MSKGPQVKCVVQEYADDMPPAGKERKLVVRNHWNMDDRVVLHVGGESYVVLAEDMIRAINAVTHARRW